MAAKSKRTKAQVELLIVGIVSVVISIIFVAVAVVSIFGGVATGLDMASLSEEVSQQEMQAIGSSYEEVASILIRMGMYFVFAGLSLFICGGYAVFASGRPNRMIRMARVSTGAIAVSAVGILWTPWKQIGLEFLPAYVLSIGVESATQYLANRIRKEATGETAEELKRERMRGSLPREERLADPTRLGFLRFIQFFFGFNIVFTLIGLIFTSRDTVTYSYSTLYDWINVVFQGVCFYMLWNRMRATKGWVIVFSAFNLIANIIHKIAIGAFVGENIGVVVLSVILLSSWDVFMIVYFLRSDRVRLIMTRDMSLTVDDDAVQANRHGLKLARNMLLYYCIFSTLGHWMESGFCYLISLGLFQGDVDMSNTMLFRDWLYPFPMHGIAVVLIALILWPLKEWLSRRLPPIPTLLASFLVNMLFCSIIEFVGGIMFNRNLQLWNYTDMPFNIMGQVCLQNAVGFGLAATIIVYVVYPFVERQVARIPNDVMNTICVGVFTFYGLLTALYVIDTSAEAAAANAAQMVNLKMGSQLLSGALHSITMGRM